MSLTPGGTSLRDQRAASTIDREVAPVWHDRFGRMLFRDLQLRPETFALDVHCASGRTTAELLQRLDDSARVLALESDPSLVTMAKARVRPEWKNRVYFKPGNLDDVTGMEAQTYDLTLANLVLGEAVHDWRGALGELLRVTKPGGQVVATTPLHGTWAEVEDLFEEVLRDYQMRDAIRMLQQIRRVRPRPRAIADALMEAGVEPDDFVVEHEQFQLLFRSGREFLFAPVIEHGPLRMWRAILGKAKDPQKLFWRFKETIDAYYAGRTLAVTVVAGLVRVRLPDGRQPHLADEYWARFPELDRIFKGERLSARGDEDDLDIDLDMDIDLDDDDEPTEPKQVMAAEPGVPEDDDIDTDAIFAALEADDDESSEDPLDLDAAFGDTFEMTQEMDPAAMQEAAALLQSPAAESEPDEPNTEELMGVDDLAEFEALAEFDVPEPQPSRPAKAPPSPAAPKEAAKPARPGPAIPPPPPTGAHKKVSLPPLPRPKKKS